MRKEIIILLMTLSIALAGILSCGEPASAEDCPLYPCQNGGVCVEGNQCECIAGSAGKHCEFLLSQCNEMDQDYTEATTLSAGCYRATADVRVGALLTIEAGSYLIFSEGTGLKVGDNGGLKAIGTEEHPIVFTAEQPVRGFWNGIHFHNSNTIDNQLEFVTVEYGGGRDFAYGSGGNVAATSSGGGVQVSLVSCNLRQSASYGLAVAGSTTMRIFSRNNLTENAKGAAIMTAKQIGSLDS